MQLSRGEARLSEDSHDLIVPENGKPVVDEPSVKESPPGQNSVQGVCSLYQVFVAPAIYTPAKKLRVHFSTVTTSVISTDTVISHYKISLK